MKVAISYLDKLLDKENVTMMEHYKVPITVIEGIKGYLYEVFMKKIISYLINLLAPHVIWMHYEVLFLN